jgi:imidazole glycerol-phosphate synthase subunit HisH
MIAIVDYHAGNLGSIKNMLKKIGYDALITNNASDIAKADHLILPGVGSFDYGMSKLKELSLLTVLEEKRTQQIPILGICLGAQLMCKASEEGVLPGLGWVDAVVKKFPIESDGVKFTVPHMGWDVVEQTKESKLFSPIHSPARFYFVHAYYITCTNQHDVLTQNSYSASYHSAFEYANILGVQYHPEKSHTFGKQLLTNFIKNY